jgi:hypothetical protein
VALGSVAVLDLEVQDPERELAFILARLQPGASIVLHDGGPEREGVVSLLDRLLAELAARDYVSVTLSELVDGATPRATPAASPTGAARTRPAVTGRLTDRPRSDRPPH